MAENPSVTLPGKVDKIIEASGGEPEKAQVSVEKGEHLYREIRIENTLTNEDGNEVRLKQGADVEVSVEANEDATVPTGSGKD